MQKYNDAINIVLQVIGEQILDAETSITGINEAEIADANIETVKAEVLSEGWSFNTVTDWTLSPEASGDNEGYIVIGENMLRVDPSDDSDNFVRHNGKLYNKETNSYIFDSSVDCDISWDMDFDDMPPIFQTYIAYKAARLTYQRLVGDAGMIQILMRDEQDLLLKMQLHEDEVNDYNIFDNNQVARAISRNTNPTGLRG